MNESNAAHLPVLLATKLLPEMEAQEAALAARHAADASHLSLSDQMMRIEVCACTRVHMCARAQGSRGFAFHTAHVGGGV